MQFTLLSLSTQLWLHNIICQVGLSCLKLYTATVHSFPYQRFMFLRSVALAPIHHSLFFSSVLCLLNLDYPVSQEDLGSYLCSFHEHYWRDDTALYKSMKAPVLNTVELSTVLAYESQRGSLFFCVSEYFRLH